MADLITGDAVPLDLRIAELPSRSLALVVDLAVQLGLLLATTTLVTWMFAAGGSPGAQAAVTLSTVVLVLVGWPTLIETLTRGRSLGKIVMGLRVLRDDGGPTRLRHSLVRALAMVFVDFWVTSGVVGGISSLASSKSKRVGDHLAGTIVVGERIPRGVAADAEIVMPTPLAGWAAGLDLVAVPDALALNVRTFLHRAPSLDPRARVSTASRLATQIAGFVRTPAPMGTPAEAYLRAVMAERTRRAAASRGSAVGRRPPAVARPASPAGQRPQPPQPPARSIPGDAPPAADDGPRGFTRPS